MLRKNRLRQRLAHLFPVLRTRPLCGSEHQLGSFFSTFARTSKAKNHSEAYTDSARAIHGPYLVRYRDAFQKEFVSIISYVHHSIDTQLDPSVFARMS